MTGLSRKIVISNCGTGKPYPGRGEENEKKIYAALVPDVPMLADDIHLKDLEMSQILAGLTMLELSGAIECGAGGYFMRRSADISKLDETEA